MKITLNSTTRIVDIVPRGLERFHANRSKARVWEGTTEGGVPVIALIPIISTRDTNRQEEFHAELEARVHDEPTLDGIQCYKPVV